MISPCVPLDSNTSGFSKKKIAVPVDPSLLRVRRTSGTLFSAKPLMNSMVVPAQTTPVRTDERVRCCAASALHPLLTRSRAAAATAVHGAGNLAATAAAAREFSRQRQSHGKACYTRLAGRQLTASLPLGGHGAHDGRRDSGMSHGAVHGYETDET